MLICIKADKKSPTWRIPIPFFFFINLLVREGLVKKLAEKCYKSESCQTASPAGGDWQQMIHNIDFVELRATLVGLKKYRGLKLVDIKSSGGEIIRIII